MPKAEWRVGELCEEGEAAEGAEVFKGAAGNDLVREDHARALVQKPFRVKEDIVESYGDL